MLGPQIVKLNLFLAFLIFVANFPVIYYLTLLSFLMPKSSKTSSGVIAYKAH